MPLKLATFPTQPVVGLLELLSALPPRFQKLEQSWVYTGGVGSMCGCVGGFASESLSQAMHSNKKVTRSHTEALKACTLEKKVLRKP